MEPSLKGAGTGLSPQDGSSTAGHDIAIETMFRGKCAMQCSARLADHYEIQTSREQVNFSILMQHNVRDSE
jgi:hypothetical protein